MLDITIKQSSEGRSLNFRAGCLFVEPHEKSLRCLSCVGFGRVQSLFPKDYALPDPMTFRVGLVVTKLPHVRTSFAPSQPQTAILKPCPNKHGLPPVSCGHEWYLKRTAGQCRRRVWKRSHRCGLQGQRRESATACRHGSR